MSADRYTIRLTGDVGHAAFPEWILRHGHKLGIRGLALALDGPTLRIDAEGPEEMVRAFALGCSLGPRDVLVEDMQIDPDTRATGAR